jgi:hypothetical protein
MSNLPRHLRCYLNRRSSLILSLSLSLILILILPHHRLRLTKQLS